MLVYQIEGNLMLLKGKLKLIVGKLTNNYFSIINGQRDLVIGKIQIQYRLSASEAKMVSTWNIPT